MKRKYIISIPEPCHENWQNMTPNEQGRFCAACQKTVTDFTYKTDTEIVAYMTEQKGDAHLCGRFSPAQLNRTVAVGLSSPSWWQKMAFGAALAAGTVFGAKAQEVHTKGDVKVQNYQVGERLFQISVSTKDQSGNLISGVEVVITDEAGVIITGGKSNLQGQVDLSFESAKRNFFVIIAENADKGRAKLFFPGGKNKAEVIATLDTDALAKTNFEVMYVTAVSKTPKDAFENSVIEIRSIVLDAATQESIPDAAIRLLDMRTGQQLAATISHTDGTFSIKLPKGYTADSVLLSTSYIGYTTKTLAISTTDLAQGIETNLENGTIDLGTIVIMERGPITREITNAGLYSCSIKTTRWQRIKNRFRRIFHLRKPSAG